ncbi:DDE-type integrase/transposase/recombinase [Prauserella rugosa]|uniref:DDE-type integrase/transposase/recombinase n=1 Tax=Prauserella rugosa TaxID=43354 RepID=UPI000AD496E8|nr:DDE-type integrase/transposase/recombinase [Prauserella rugosa]
MFGKKRRSRKALPGQSAHEDLVRREFTAEAPNRLWLTDITEHPTGEGKIYSVRSRTCSRTGSWATPSTSQLGLDALEPAIARRGGTVADCRLHSDRGGQFRSKKLQQALWRHHMRGSMGQAGAPVTTPPWSRFIAVRIG